MNLYLKKENLRILITGGAGFIGGCLVRRLLSTSKAKIFNLDKISYTSDLSFINNYKNKKNHFHLNYDISNPQETNEALKKSDPDIIFHLAAESHVDRSIDNPKPFIESNILGTFNILESARNHWNNLDKKRKKSFRLIHISTDEVFGSLGKVGKFSENTKYDPRSPYSASKAASDHLTSAWFHTYKMPIIITNCSNNFGPFQFPDKLIPLVITKGLNNLRIPVYGNGENIRDWLFVEDHIDALLLVSKKGSIGKSYCIGGNCEKTNLEIVESITNLLDKKLKKEFSHKDLITFVKDRPGHDKRYAINFENIKKELKWKPNHSFEEGLSKTVDWYLDNQNWVKAMQHKSGYKGDRLGLPKTLTKED